MIPFRLEEARRDADDDRARPLDREPRVPAR
jgi:hypothetical protein